MNLRKFIDIIQDKNLLLIKVLTIYILSNQPLIAIENCPIIPNDKLVQMLSGVQNNSTTYHYQSASLKKIFNFTQIAIVKPESHIGNLRELLSRPYVYKSHPNKLVAENHCSYTLEGKDQQEVKLKINFHAQVQDIQKPSDPQEQRIFHGLKEILETYKDLSKARIGHLSEQVSWLIGYTGIPKSGLGLDEENKLQEELEMLIKKYETHPDLLTAGSLSAKIKESLIHFKAFTGRLIVQVPNDSSKFHIKTKRVKGERGQEMDSTAMITKIFIKGDNGKNYALYNNKELDTVTRMKLKQKLLTEAGVTFIPDLNNKRVEFKESSDQADLDGVNEFRGSLVVARNVRVIR